MNRFNRVLSLAILSCGLLQAHSNVSPTLAFRSQGFHGDRQRNVGEVGKIYLSDTQDEWYRTTDIAVGYMRSFHTKEIARCLFGDDLICNDNCNNTIKVQGSGVADRDAKAWLADYLYLACDYDGSFRIDPRIQNVVVDLDMYVGLDEWAEGLYFRLYGPINWTKWDARFCTTDPATVTTTSCSTGYFTPTGSEVLLDSLASYFAGNSPAPVDNITFKGLKFAKMPSCDESKVGFAELRAELGWNFFQDDDYHLGAGLHVAAPTGNKRKAEFVMFPVVGNGNHWELGGTLHGHYMFWRSDDEERHAGFYFDAVFTHLFRAREQRTFDLCDKPNSRYMLASKFTRTITNFGTTAVLSGIVNNGTLGIPKPAFAQFNNIYAPVANLTTTDVKVDVGIQADVTAMFNFTRKQFSWDLGYNFWGRTCEKIECPRPCDSCSADSIFNFENENKWGLKGDARMFGFNGSTDAVIPLSATQSSATIHAGTNAGTVDATLTDVSLQNGGVDHSLFALVDFNVRVIHTPTTQGGLNINANQMRSSFQPVFISTADVSLQKTKGLSHKVFTNLSYNLDREWNPFIGIGGSAEFGKTSCGDCSGSSTCCTTNCCDSCSYCSLSQWSIWVKGGVSFD